MINKLKDLRAGGEEEGFTLIELMIVVVIIGILAAIAIPVFANQQKSAINAGVISDVKNTNTNLATALVKSPTAPEVAVLFGLYNGQAFNEEVATTFRDNMNSSNNYELSLKSVPRSDTATTITIWGAWDNYQIIGENASTDFTATYRADTGKLTTVG